MLNLWTRIPSSYPTHVRYLSRSIQPRSWRSPGCRLSLGWRELWQSSGWLESWLPEEWSPAPTFSLLCSNPIGFGSKLQVATIHRVFGRSKFTTVMQFYQPALFGNSNAKSPCPGLKTNSEESLAWGNNSRLSRVDIQYTLHIAILPGFLCPQWIAQFFFFSPWG